MAVFDKVYVYYVSICVKKFDYACEVRARPVVGIYLLLADFVLSLVQMDTCIATYFCIIFMYMYMYM